MLFKVPNIYSNKNLFSFLAIFILSIPGRSSLGSEIEALKKQLKVLEQKIERLEVQEKEKNNQELERKVNELEAREKEGKGKVGTFIADHVSFGGFFEHAITANFSEDREYQLSASSHILGLNLGVKLNDKFRLVSQELFFLTFPLSNPHDVTKRDFNNNPSFGALVAHAYGEYTYSEKLKVQTGLGWAPFGIALANRELPLLIRRNGPMLGSLSLTMPYTLWTGLHVLGEFGTDYGRFGYNAYSSTSPTNADKLGGGSRLWWSSPKDEIKIGASQQIIHWNSELAYNLGADLELKFSRYGLRAEYARSLIDGEDIWTVYAEPYVEFGDGKWVLHADVDYAKRPFHTGDLASFTPFERWDLGGGINWLPWPFLRTRLLFLYHNYVGASARSSGKNNDFYTLEYSAGIEF